MGVGALDGYKDANDRVLDLWEQGAPTPSFLSLASVSQSCSFRALEPIRKLSS